MQLSARPPDTDEKPMNPSDASFSYLVESRKEWIANVLQPWSVAAKRVDLRLAAEEWNDIAGRVDPNATLWTWAWSRFPDLVHEGLPGVNETCEVRVTLKDGTTGTGFPDGRQTENGALVLVSPIPDSGHYGPWSIDDIVSVEKLDAET